MSLFCPEMWKEASEQLSAKVTRCVCLALGSFHSKWQTQMQLLLLNHLVSLLDVSSPSASLGVLWRVLRSL